MKGTYDEIIRNIFTKYAEIALVRARRNYLEQENRIIQQEERIELEAVYDEYREENYRFLEAAFDIPWEAETIRNCLRQQVSERMEAAFLGLTDLEVLIVYAKVFRQLTFVEIGKAMEIDWKKAASIYSYARKKLKKGWEANGI